MRSPAHVGLAALLATSITACTGAEAPAPTELGARRVAPSAVLDFTTSPWVRPAEAGTVVARVGGAPIHLSTLQDALRDAPDQTGAQLLERLIDLEVLAQEAMRRGLQRAESVAGPWRQALAHRALTEVFEAEVRPEDLTLERARQIYRIPRVRKLYDHADAWRMAHVFFSCCDAKIERCDKPEVVQCFADAGTEIQTVYDQLMRATMATHGDPAAVADAMKTFRQDVAQRWPQLAYRERSFYYDPGKPHADQKGYTVIAEAVSRGVIEAPLAVPQAPVQSPFGWHILVKLDHDPESRKGPDHPEVIADIRKNAFPELRKAKFRDLLTRLHTTWGTRLELEASTAAGRPLE